MIERHVVLIAPEIHWNTGNVGRTCIGAGASLHLIKPLGFSLESREVKRAGLDYWPDVKLFVWNSFQEFHTVCRPPPEEIVLFSKTGKHPVWNLPKPEKLYLIFGSETRGIPEDIRQKFSEENIFHIPIKNNIRSLNLSTSVGIALYESLRLSPAFHQW
jgi:tRNA (cytidine/uridine-2'-O-)-methyltransferase